MVGLLLVCLVLVLTDSSNYHQDDYAVKLQRADMEQYNKVFLENPTVALVYYNRSYRGINATFNLRKDVSDMTVKFQTYTFLSNEYRFFPITMEVDGCKSLTMDEFGVRSSLEIASNVPFRCPLKKGLLKLTYAKIDFSNFPPFVPAGQYKVAVTVHKNLDFLLKMNVYAKIDTILKIWEN